MIMIITDNVVDNSISLIIISVLYDGEGRPCWENLRRKLSWRTRYEHPIFYIAVLHNKLMINEHDNNVTLQEGVEATLGKSPVQVVLDIKV